MIDINELRQRVKEVCWPTSPFTVDELLELLDRLEAAEKLNAEWLKANAPGGWIDALRIKIKRMKQQEPVAWLDDGTCRSGSESTSLRVVTEETKRDMPRSVATSFSTPLYALPGAKGEV